MHRLVTEATIAALASLALAGCASWSSPPPATSTVARSAAPTRYEETVTNYFDLTMPPQTSPRKLTIGAPEGSPCALHGTGGRHVGWMVPVIYDTTPPTTSAMPQRNLPSAKAGNDKNAKTAKSNAATPLPLKSTTSGTPSAGGTPTGSLKEVKVEGTRYFFWFSSETLAAVSRTPDACP